MIQAAQRSMQQLSQDFGSLVLATGSDSFTPQFYDTCRKVFGNDQCNIFIFAEGLEGHPEVMFSHAAEDELRRLTREMCDEYVAVGFRADPTLAWARARMARQGRPLIRNVSRQSIGDATYRTRFYDQALVRQKLAMLCHDGDSVVYLNLYRNPEQLDFRDQDYAQFEQIGSLLVALLHKHNRLTRGTHGAGSLHHDMSPEFREKLLQRVQSALRAEYRDLTPREAEVCSAVAIGLTTEGIGLTLGISVNTVATHRKRAYAKLGISSQNELFARHHTAVANHINALRMN